MSDCDQARAFGSCAACGPPSLTGFLLARIAEDDARSLSGQHGKPDRVGLECEAKRRIVEDARDMTADSGMYGHGWRLLEFLAMPYASHPDYQERWKVERWKV